MEPNTQRLFQGASGAAGENLYIEDVFSTYLYSGNGGTQTITNGIDLAGEGGLVWVKARDTSETHILTDTERGAPKALTTAGPAAQFNSDITGFTSTGFTVGNTYGPVNNTNQTQASWTFRKAEKFFDVVTYTGTGSARTVAHNLGSVPGMIVTKRTDVSSDWAVYHRSNEATKVQYLQTTDAAITASNWWNDTEPTSTVFTVGTTNNVSGGTYVAYLFAHDAGGFGDDGTESVIKCGSFTTDGSGNATVDLGWEPQWVLIKRASAPLGLFVDDWNILDSMRGFTVANAAYLNTNTSSAEGSPTTVWSITNTGFKFAFGGDVSSTYIYIAIRRGPMKTPTDATKVFSALTATGSSGTSRSIGFAADMIWGTARGGDAWRVQDRLRGFPVTANSGNVLLTTSTNAEAAIQPNIYNVDNISRLDGGATATVSYLWHHFRRAPGFFDVVAYTGTGSARTVSHNLGVAPELMIVKRRDSSSNWIVYHSALSATHYIELNQSDIAYNNSSIWNNTIPSSSAFSLGNSSLINSSGGTYIAYLFATVAGVSKVGSYTGTGTTLQVDCGFAAGARLVLIKRTDSTGDWYVWDTARGIVTGNDPYLLINSTAAEVTSTDYIDPYSAGFEISSTAPAAINENGGSFIYLAIA